MLCFLRRTLEVFCVCQTGARIYGVWLVVGWVDNNEPGSFRGRPKAENRKITINPFAFSVVVVSKTRPQSKKPFPKNLCNPKIAHVVERNLTNPINK